MTKNQCPLVDWYTFCGKCTITTCQNHTSKTLKGCLSLDRTERSDRITDTELLHYKVIPNADKMDSNSLDSKFTAYLRKKCVTAVKGNMVFYLYVAYVSQKYTPHPKFNYIPGVTSFIDNLVSNFPFNQSEVTFEPWMLPYLVDPKIYKKFLETQGRNSGDAVTLVVALGITPGKYKNLCQAIKDFNKRLKEYLKKTKEN